MKCRFNALCVRAVCVALVLHLGACSREASEAPGTSERAPASKVSLASGSGLASGGGLESEREISPESMRILRLNAWQLLAPFVRHTEGLPRPNAWKPRHQLLPLANGPMQSSGVSMLQRAMELQSTKQDVPLPLLYEMTFFNAIASEYIGSEALRERGTTDLMLAEQRREIEFPRGSVAVKTFWRLMDGERIEVMKWEWNATGTREQLPGNLLKPRCVAREAVDGCVKATDAFYTIRVQDPKDFSCPSDAPCSQLKKDDLLLLVALHIASKQMPEWLWATFWWRDADAPRGTFWTCGDAQRKDALGELKPPWSNYSMDVTASFTMTKPRPETEADAACGFPGEIGDGEQLRAAYNPFVEALMPRGLKSSCIDCHSRASTNPDKNVPFGIPPVGDPAGPRLSDFEGHLRLDYMWSLRMGGLRATEFPHDNWPLPQ